MQMSEEAAEGRSQMIVMVYRAMPLFLLPALTLIRLLASLFLEGMITNEDTFDDQIN